MWDGRFRRVRLLPNSFVQFKFSYFYKRQNDGRGECDALYLLKLWMVLEIKKNSKLTYGSWHYKHWRYNTMFARVFDLNRDNCNSKYNLYHGKSLAFSVWYLLVHDKIYGATKESGQFTTLNIWLYQRANLYSLCWEKSFKIRSLMNANAKYSLFRRFLNQNFSQFLCAFDTVCHKTLLFETL